MFFFIFSHMNERQGCEKKDLYRIKHGSQGSSVIFFKWVYVLLHYLLHTVAKARAPGLKKERLVYIQQKLFFLVYVLFSLRLRCKALEKKNLQIIKHISKSPKHPVNFSISSMCLKKSCFLHTAAKTQASSQTNHYTFFAGYLFFFTICCTRLLRCEQHGWEKRDLYIFTHFSLGPKHPVPIWDSSMCLKNVSCTRLLRHEYQNFQGGICSFSLFAAHGH